MACLGHELYELGWPRGISSMRHATPHERAPTEDEGIPAWGLREPSSATAGRKHMDTAATEVRAAPAVEVVDDVGQQEERANHVRGETETRR